MASISASDLIASSPPVPQHELAIAQSQKNPHLSLRFSNTPFMSSAGSGSGAPGGRSPSLNSEGAFPTNTNKAVNPANAFPSHLAAIEPKPDYVSQPNASLVSSDFLKTKKELESWHDEDTAGDPEKVAISEGAVASVNLFLDKILYDILATAQSTRLPQLRGATADTLRRNLGRDAIAFADANIEDLLAGGDDEDDEDDEEPQDKDTVLRREQARWNLEYSWKRSRLRVMMRSEKSDFDIDDDERWVQETHLLPPGRRVSETTTLLSLQSEIFLAGILDFLSDQLLALSLIPATARTRRASKRTPSLSNDAAVLLVEEADLERGVLNSPLDRLWRSWRKAVRGRSSSIPLSPRLATSFSTSSSPATTRRGSTQWADASPHINESDVLTPRGMPGDFIHTPLTDLPPSGELDMFGIREDMSRLTTNAPTSRRNKDGNEVEGLGLTKGSSALGANEQMDGPRRKSEAAAADQAAASPKRSPLHRTRSNSDPVQRGWAEMSPSQAFGFPTSHADETRNDRNKAAKDLEGSSEHASTYAQQNDEMPLTPRRMNSTAASRRNREASVGMGLHNGISMPRPSIDEEEDVDGQDPGRDHNRSPIDPRLRAASPSSDTEVSEIVSPREFMMARNLHSTRDIRFDGTQIKNYTQNPSPNRHASPKMQIQTLGIPSGLNTETDPVSPLTRSELALDDRSEGARPTNLSTLASASPTSPTSAMPRRNTSARLVDDLARARGSPTVRQVEEVQSSPVQRKESLLRRIAGANGSKASLVDESLVRPKPKTGLTSSSITSAEDFDTLLNGGETIKMTLSPSSIRELPSNPASPAMSLGGGAFTKMNGSSGDLSRILRKKLPEDVIDATPKSPSIGGSGSSDKGARSRSASNATDRSAHSMSRPAARNTNKTKAGHMAREATVQTDSVRDFADFIRSTGPDREPQMPVPASANRQGSTGGLTTEADSTPVSMAPKVPNISSIKARAEQARAEQARAAQVHKVSEGTGLKYKRNWEAREARGAAPAGNDGLIDFIRTGPNTGHNSRPSKDIAPFRYSMDEEDMKAIAPISLDDPPPGHRGSVGTMNTMGTMTTYNSHAPLVDRDGSYMRPPSPQLDFSILQSNTNVPKSPTKPVKPVAKATTTSDGVRRYRNKDPYALDFSDDDDDDEEQPAQRAQYGKPIAFTRIIDPSTAAALPSPPPPLSPSYRGEAPPASGLALNGVSYTPDLQSDSFSARPSSRPGTGRLQSAVSTPVLNGNGKPAGGIIPRNPNRARMEVRPAAAARQTSSTRDLADFLRDSGPPEATPRSMQSGGGGNEDRYHDGAPSPNIGSGYGHSPGKEEGKKKFWSRKRYVDLP